MHLYSPSPLKKYKILLHWKTGLHNKEREALGQTNKRVVGEWDSTLASSDKKEGGRQCLSSDRWKAPLEKLAMKKKKKKSKQPLQGWGTRIPTFPAH